MTVARVIGLGQRAGGDDGVGLVVLERLRAIVPSDVELLEIAEPCGIIPLLASSVPIVIVDAIVIDGTEPGELVELEADALSRHVRGVSTHGVDLAHALSLARVLAEPGSTAASVRIIGVTIAAPDRRAIGLSPTVAAAVPRAVQAVQRALSAPH